MSKLNKLISETGNVGLIIYTYIFHLTTKNNKNSFFMSQTTYKTNLVIKHCTLCTVLYQFVKRIL